MQNLTIKCPQCGKYYYHLQFTEGAESYELECSSCGFFNIGLLLEGEAINQSKKHSGLTFYIYLPEDIDKFKTKVNDLGKILYCPKCGKDLGYGTFNNKYILYNCGSCGANIELETNIG